MTPIRVVELIGPVCVDPEDGAMLCQQTHTALTQGAGIVLDFSGVRTLTSSFLNSAVACLFASYSVDTLSQKLKWTGLDSTDEKLVHLVLKNAARFYKATPDQQAAIMAASSRAIED
jgi:hypothetical protein